MNVSIEKIAAFLYREARLLDDEQWDEWLECYDPDARFWMPSWDDDGRLVHDLDLPQPAQGPGFHMVTGVREHHGRVWLGSLHEAAVAVHDLP